MIWTESPSCRWLPAALQLLLLAAVVTSTSGCAAIAERVASHLATRDVQAIEHDFTLFEADLALYRHCLKERGGACDGDAATPLAHSTHAGGPKPAAPIQPGASATLADSVASLPPGHPARAAHATLSHPLARKSAAVHNHLRGHDDGAVPGVTVHTGEGAHGPESTVEIEMKLDEAHDFHRHLLSSLGTTAWDALHGHCKTLHPEASDRHHLEADCRRAAFIRGYLDAYFRHGELLKVDLARTRGSVEAGDGPSADPAALSNVVRVSHAGFVSRDTLFHARVPTLEVTLDPAASHLVTFKDLDTQQLLTGGTHLGQLGVAQDKSGVGTGASIGAELVRIFLEAVFDAHEGLPAVAPANAPGLKATGLTLGEHSLPVFTSPMGHVDHHDYMRMARTNHQVATKTRAILSRVIAGIGPFSLNNPALESFLVELVSTSVRKATEKATWCWYACNLDADLARLEADAEIAVRDEVNKEVEHVRLKLKISS